MIWFVLIGILVLCAITVRTYTRAQSRAMVARVEGTRPEPLSAARLQAELLAIGEDPAIIATETGEGLTVVTWDLDSAAGHGTEAREEDHGTQMIELAIRSSDRPVVEARFAVGEVSLEKDESGNVLSTVAWDWPLVPEFGDADVGAAAGRRTMAALVAPVREVVLAAGYAWQPTITREVAASEPTHPGGRAPAAKPAERPEDILKERTLSEDQKVRALEEMRVDQELLQVADDEGMQGGTPPDLQRVRKAERKLDDASGRREGPS